MSLRHDRAPPANRMRKPEYRPYRFPRHQVSTVRGRRLGNARATCLSRSKIRAAQIPRAIAYNAAPEIALPRQPSNFAPPTVLAAAAFPRASGHPRVRASASSQDGTSARAARAPLRTAAGAFPAAPAFRIRRSGPRETSDPAAIRPIPAGRGPAQRSSSVRRPLPAPVARRS